MSRDDPSNVKLSGATYSSVGIGAIIDAGKDLTKNIRFIPKSGNSYIDSSFEMPGLTTFALAHTQVGKGRQPQTGSRDLRGIKTGGYRVTITASLYIEEHDNAIFAAAKNNESFGVELEWGVSDGKRYFLYYPTCYFSADSLTVPDPDSEDSPIREVTILPVRENNKDSIDPYGRLAGCLLYTSPSPRD